MAIVASYNETVCPLFQ